MIPLGDISATQGDNIMDSLAGISRGYADQAIVDADVPGNSKKLVKLAKELLAAGDALRDDGNYKDAVTNYKDAVTEAQS